MKLLPLAATVAALGIVTAGCGGGTDGAGQAGQPTQQGDTAAATPTQGEKAPAIRGERPYKAIRIQAPKPGANVSWGKRLAPAAVAGEGGTLSSPDLNGDGVPDYFVGQPNFSTQQTSNVGRVWLVSGKTGEIIYNITSPQPQAKANFGFFLAVLGDVDGDSKPDIAVGTDAQDIDGNKDQGAAWVFSGADGELLYRLDNPRPQAEAGFGSRIGRAGDVTGDGVPDVLVGAPGNDKPAGCSQKSPQPQGCRKDQGQAFIFSGANGELVRTLNLPARDQQRPSCSEDGDCGSFGLTVGGPGDVNGDNITDQLVSAPTLNGARGRMYVFSGKTGRLLLTIKSPQPQPGALFGFHEAAALSPGDVNNDGVADIYGNGFLQDTNQTSGEAEGKAWIFSGKNGKVLYPLTDPTPTPGGQFGWSMTRTGYNDDGTPDVYVGQAPHHVEGTPQNGGTYVFDGRDASVLQVLEIPRKYRQEGSNPRLGWALAAPGDLNGDGLPDYVGGAPFADVSGNKDQGVIYVYLSQGGSN